MSMNDMKEKVIREFRLTTLALKNRNTVFLLTFIILVFGLVSYVRLPKELFPQVNFPTILVQTTYPGNAPVDIENLITRPLEKELDGVDGLKEIRSTSAQDASMVFVEFNTDVLVKDARQEVKDAVDNAMSELPNDLMFDPVIIDFNFDEFPIININLSGDYSIEELKSYAEYLEDQIEGISEISKVNIEGTNDREVQIDVDLRKLESHELTFDDIEFAVTAENVSISGGEIKLGSARRSIRTLGEFNNVNELRNIIVSEENGNVVYLKDVAQVTDGYAEPTSYARLDRDPVVSVQVVKKSGENLLSATDKIFRLLDQAKASHQLPENLEVTLTNDQSDMIRKQLRNLENSMIMGVILVVLVLFYFLGTRNALFVGLAIPLSMFLSFSIISLIGYKINMIVLFSLILALGMLVDNAIVVVENIYRFVDRGFPPFEAARRAVGEIAVPIIASTATTLAAFLPLAFWGGITGEFMKNLPITLIIVLTSSLFVALVIIPVFSARFIRSGAQMEATLPNRKRAFIIIGIMLALSVPFYLSKAFLPANLLAIFSAIYFLNVMFFYKAERWFRNVFLVWLEKVYVSTLRFALRKYNPYFFFGGTFMLLILAIMFYFSSNPKVTFFPVNQPGYINMTSELAVGTDITATNAFTRQLEDDLFDFLTPYQDIVKSVLTTVGVSASGDDFESTGAAQKAVTTVTFVDYQDRGGINTSEVMAKMADAFVNRYPGVRISLEKDDMGPPVGKPINLEIYGDDFDVLASLADSIKLLVAQQNIPGIEGLVMDMNTGKPELLVNIDREKARRYGLSTYQIANTLRTALFGKEISDFKVGEDEYPIQLRLREEDRHNVTTLMNQKISFREDGQLIQIPITAVADFQYSTTYGSVRRMDMKRTVTLSSNVVEGYNANDINGQLAILMQGFDMPEGYSYKFTGEQEAQQESMAFLERAMLIAVALILLILVSQFNSMIRPLIIMASVLFSTIGVFGGLATFKMDFVVVMTGIGIVALAGIVVNNAIVLIDYIELLKKRKREELGLDEEAFLPVKEATECIVTAGKTRLRPVLLTAITTVLGLIPLAIGMNIDFESMLSRFDGQLYFGGDQVLFWGPISWTIIFGLVFATFLTLVIVPVMYRITVNLHKKWINLFHLRKEIV